MITCNIMMLRNSIKTQLLFLEADATAKEKNLATRLTNEKVALRESRAMSWGASQRLLTIEAKIASIEGADSHYLFSQDDEGKSDAVEILDHYRKKQRE